jgi:hypothetical protein
MQRGKMIPESLPPGDGHVLGIARLIDPDHEPHLEDAEDHELGEGDGKQDIEDRPRHRARGEQVHDADASVQHSLR